MGYLNTDNVSFTLVPIFLNGTTFDDDGDPVDTQVLLHGTVNTPSIYATDTFISGPWAITLSGRYNHTSLDNLDYLPPSAARGNLTSNNLFQRFNPAAGFTYKPSDSSTPISITARQAALLLPLSLVAPIQPSLVICPMHWSAIRLSNRWSRGPWKWASGVTKTSRCTGAPIISLAKTITTCFSSRPNRQGSATSSISVKHAGMASNLELSQDWRQWSIGSNYTFMNATYQSPQTIDGGTEQY